MKMTLSVCSLLTHGHNLLTGSTGDKILHLNSINVMEIGCYIKKYTLKPEKI